MEPTSRTATASCSGRSWPTSSPGSGDRSHQRKITEQNGRDSLAVAWPPTGLAQALIAESQTREGAGMLLKRHFERLLLRPSDLKPLRDDFEVVGVFNPGAIVGRRRSHPPGPGGGASARAPRRDDGAAALGPRRGPGDRLGP